jgi:hypothetical protein
MQFSIGTRIYVIRRRWSLRCQGEDLEGLCDSSTRTIWLDGELGAESIIDVLRHEHAHAWQFEVGTPGNDEDQANFSATVSDAFDQQFTDQGGLEALLGVTIEGLRPRGLDGGGVQPRGTFNITDRIECGRCHAQVMVGSIASSSPRLHEAAGFFMLDRGCVCPVCEAVQAWSERCTPDGLPLGEFFNPRILTGPEAGDWLRAHPNVSREYNVA